MDIAAFGLLAYGVIAALVLIDSIVPLVPSEAVVVAAAASTAVTNGLSLPGIIGATTVGAFAGDVVVHLLGGYAHGRWLGRIERTRGWSRAMELVRRGGVGVVVVGRFVPLGRTAAAFVTGTTTMAWQRYLPAAALGATTWAIVISALGRAGAGLTGNIVTITVIGLIGATLLGGLASVLLRRRFAVRTPDDRGQSCSERIDLIPATNADDEPFPSAA